MFEKEGVEEVPIRPKGIHSLIINDSSQYLRVLTNKAVILTSEEFIQEGNQKSLFRGTSRSFRGLTTTASYMYRCCVIFSVGFGIA